MSRGIRRAKMRASIRPNGFYWVQFGAAPPCEPEPIPPEVAEWSNELNHDAGGWYFVGIEATAEGTDNGMDDSNITVLAGPLPVPSGLSSK